SSPITCSINNTHSYCPSSLGGFRGMIPMIKELKVEGIPVKLFIFSFVSLFIMKRYIKIGSPYR
ncbi:hypothetical protein ABNB82_21625, partial [Paenibacillus larvae]